ncbi:MAG: 3-isopropylmalate dehydratase small subunit [Candidatus Peribacteraceae bacterium]|nr:3-isopropylmalate dehydratase small subunit [Candidatus Peribacteraceae bacterium]
MESFSSLTSLVLPLPLADIDTDLILPAQHLTNVSREGFGEHLFERLRQDHGSPLSDERFAEAKILITRKNFGCGSSREHAVWAILSGGFRVIIAPSFADIFTSNSGKNGLVLVALPEPVIEQLLVKAAKADLQATVDLNSQTVTFSDGSEHSFHIDPFRRDCILHGYDDLQYILSHEKEIDRCKKEREKQEFYSTLKPNRGISRRQELISIPLHIKNTMH